MSGSDLVDGELLVDTAWLAEHLDDEDLLVFDCTTVLVPDPVVTYTIASGIDGYLEGHVPGAAYLNVQDDLSDTSAPHRFMLPDPATFAANVGRLGIGDATRVVLYSRTQLYWATRAWFALHAHGFDRAAVLDGGFPRWVEEGRPVSSGAVHHPPAIFTPHRRPDVVTDVSGVREAIGQDRTVIVNALSAEQHAGTGGNSFGRPGRIPGSVNVPYASVADLPDGSLRDRAVITDLLESAGVTPDKRVVNYCGGGLSATIGLFAQKLLGYDDVALYDASMQEWALDPSLPMERDRP